MQDTMKLSLLLASTAVLILCVSGEESFTTAQKKCKDQFSAMAEKREKNDDICPESKQLICCLAKIDPELANKFVDQEGISKQCEFSDQEMENIQDSCKPTTITPSNSSAGLAVMKALLTIVTMLILQALCF